MMALLLAATHASAGDRDPLFIDCVSTCASPIACAGWSEENFGPALMGWSCLADCHYLCMMKITAARQNALPKLSVLQYHGKWPFVRLLCMQEPASVLFSLANDITHAIGLNCCWPLAASVEGGWAWRVLGILSVNAWTWASVFHCRDVYWTQCADYFSATLLVGFGALVATQQVLMELGGSGSRLHTRVMPPLTLMASAAFAEYVRRMLRHFDFGQNVRISVTLGALQMSLWVLWWLLCRRERPHAWKAPAVSILSAALLLTFELGDFPPLLGILDSHAIWHFSTVPAAAVFWHGLVAPELRWRLAVHGQPAPQTRRSSSHLKRKP